MNYDTLMKLVENSPYTLTEAKQNKLIDGVAYFDDIKSGYSMVDSI